VADFAIVDVGDRSASSWLLVVFTVPVRLAAAREYCETVWAGDGGEDGGRRSTLPVRRRACGDLLSSESKRGRAGKADGMQNWGELKVDC
jgi:hypothetical protein